MILLSALLALVPQAAPAQDHAARVDRFLAALPPSSRDGADKGETEADAADVKRLVAANPDKEARIRATIAARVACVDKASGEFPLRALRKSAEMLSDAELDKLTEFYSGSDYAKLIATGEKADIKPFLNRYPLARFNEVTQRVMADAPTEMFEAFDACRETADAALIAAGVKD